MALEELVRSYGYVAVLTGTLLEGETVVIIAGFLAHLGYLLVAFLAGGPQAVTAVTFYLLAYFITTLGAFAVITALSNKETDFSHIAGYRGLAFRHRFLGSILAAMMFSLAGIPLTAGFFAKFYVLLARPRAAGGAPGDVHRGHQRPDDRRRAGRRRTAHG